MIDTRQFIREAFARDLFAITLEYEQKAVHTNPASYAAKLAQAKRDYFSEKLESSTDAMLHIIGNALRNAGESDDELGIYNFLEAAANTEMHQGNEVRQLNLYPLRQAILDLNPNRNDRECLELITAPLSEQEIAEAHAAVRNAIRREHSAYRA